MPASSSTPSTSRLAVLLPLAALVVAACGDDAGGAGGSGGAPGAGGDGPTTTATTTATTGASSSTGDGGASSSTGDGGASSSTGDGGASSSAGSGGAGGDGGGAGAGGEGGSSAALPACEDYRAAYLDVAASLDCANPEVESPTYCDTFEADPCLDERNAYWTCAGGALPDASCDCVAYQGQLLLVCGVCPAELDALTGCSVQ